jgi:hypothetical protein
VNKKQTNIVLQENDISGTFSERLLFCGFIQGTLLVQRLLCENY